MIVFSLFSSEDHKLVRQQMERLTTLSFWPGGSSMFHSYQMASPLSAKEEHIPVALLDCAALSAAPAEQQAARLGMAIGEARSVGQGRLLLYAIYRSGCRSAAASRKPTEYPADSSPRSALRQLGAVQDRAQNRSYYSDLVAAANCAVATAEIAYDPQRQDEVSTARPISGQSLHYRLTAASAGWWRVTTALVAPHQQRGWIIDSPTATEEKALLQQLLTLSAQELLTQPSVLWSAPEQQLVAQQVKRWSLSHQRRHQLQELLQRYMAQHGSFPAQLLQESHTWQRFRHEIDAA